ncbi:TIGR02117 family protein [Sphingomonas sp. Sphisp140]|uniref:TIGR02117 family protein n=1 Tax=unclassified Sphingomonas TaxID=196159 RepID=UPI0039B00008
MRIVGRLAGGLILLVVAYLAAAALGAGLAVNGGREPPAEGVRIYVADNGVHTDLILPAAAFRDIARPEHLRDPRYGTEPYLAFGWGDRDFYLHTASWGDVNAWRVAKAMVGAGSTVLHVAHVPEPRAGGPVRTLLLRPEEYRRLVEHVRTSFAAGPVVRGYGARDAFYTARGGYSAIRTCNEWTGRGLRKAGVPMGIWTPLPWGVMLWL